MEHNGNEKYVSKDTYIYVFLRNIKAIKNTYVKILIFTYFYGINTYDTYLCRKILKWTYLPDWAFI